MHSIAGWDPKRGCSMHSTVGWDLEGRDPILRQGDTVLEAGLSEMRQTLMKMSAVRPGRDRYAWEGSPAFTRIAPLNSCMVLRPACSSSWERCSVYLGCCCWLLEWDLLPAHRCLELEMLPAHGILECDSLPAHRFWGWDLLPAPRCLEWDLVPA